MLLLLLMLVLFHPVIVKFIIINTNPDLSKITFNLELSPDFVRPWEYGDRLYLTSL